MRLESKPRRSLVGVDIYCGAGGMSLGFEQAGFKVKAAFDLDPVHVRAHERNFQTCITKRADVSQLSGEQIRTIARISDRELDILFGGPPCQGFSEIGRRQANDPRNDQVLQFARLVGELAPRYFVLENVPGLLFDRHHAALERFLACVGTQGYSLVTPIQKLEASQFGVPQRRQRVFLIGYRKDQAAPCYPEPIGTQAPNVWDAIGDLAIIDLEPSRLEGDLFAGELGVPSVYAQILRGETRDPLDRSSARRNLSRGVSGCLAPKHGASTVARFAATAPGHREAVARFLRLEMNGLSPTLRAGTGSEQGSFTAPRPIHPVYPRCITVREGARLHSLPDWFALDSTKWHGFRQVGNAVPPFLARAVAASIIDASLNRGGHDEEREP